MNDLHLIEARLARTQEPVFNSPWCPIPDARLLEYRRLIAHVPAMVEEIKELREQLKNKER